MSLHLSETAKVVEPARHAVLLLDEAGWHLSEDPELPANITILSLPARCLELNGIEHIWQFMCNHWLSNRVFTGHDDIIGCHCFGWNRLIEMPWPIMSIEMRDWAHWS
jgi:transposase